MGIYGRGQIAVYGSPGSAEGWVPATHRERMREELICRVAQTPRSRKEGKIVWACQL